jgi:hypothetical protein
MVSPEPDTWWSSLAYAAWDRLFGLRVTQRVHPEIEALAGARITGGMAELDLLALRMLLLEGLDAAVDMYLQLHADQAHRQADNIARALVQAEQDGVL